MSGLWFDALAGICAHVRGGGGGLTPSDIAPARLTQQQIDELCQSHEVADVLPLTPLQQGLLFHANVAHSSGDDVYAVQMDVTLSGRLDHAPLTEAVQTAGPIGIQIWRPSSATGSTCRCRFISADPELPWQLRGTRR